MEHKHFSIIKAFEYAFDSIAHHPKIFLQLVLLIGLPMAGWFIIDQYYLHPALKDAWRAIKYHVVQTEMGKKLGFTGLSSSQLITPNNQALTDIKILVDRSFQSTHGKSTPTNAEIRNEAARPTLERIIAFLGQPELEKIKEVQDERGVLAEKVSYESLGLLILKVILGVFISLAVFIALEIFMTRLLLDFYDFHTIRIAYAFESIGKVFWVSLITWLGYQLLVCLGLLFLIIPGIIIALRYLFAITLIVDGKAHTTREAFGMSAGCTDGAKWQLLLLLMCFGILHNFSLYALWLSLLMTPILGLASIYVYKKLLSQCAQAHSDVRA